MSQILNLYHTFTFDIRSCVCFVFFVVVVAYLVILTQNDLILVIYRRPSLSTDTKSRSTGLALNSWNFSKSLISVAT